MAGNKTTIRSFLRIIIHNGRFRLKENDCYGDESIRQAVNIESQRSRI
jgi:hypothetical protein